MNLCGGDVLAVGGCVERIGRWQLCSPGLHFLGPLPLLSGGQLSGYQADEAREAGAEGQTWWGHSSGLLPGTG